MLAGRAFVWKPVRCGLAANGQLQLTAPSMHRPPPILVQHELRSQILTPSRTGTAIRRLVFDTGKAQSSKLPML